MRKIFFFVTILSIISCKSNHSKTNEKAIVSIPNKELPVESKNILVTTKDTIHLSLVNNYNISSLDSVTKQVKKIKAKYLYSHKSIVNRNLIKSLKNYENSTSLQKIRSALRLTQEKDTFSINIKQNVKLPSSLEKNTEIILDISIYSLYYDNKKSNYLLINKVEL